MHTDVNPTWLELDERVSLAAREPRMLESFFDSAFPRVWGFVRRMIKDTHLAEDLTQEVFLRLHRGIDHYDPSLPLRPWVFTIAANVVRDHLRSNATRVELHHVSIDDSEVQSSVATPVGEADHEQNAALVARAIENLPSSIKEVFLLRYEECFSYTAISSTLEISEVAARQRYSRALVLLRRSLPSSAGKPRRAR